MGLHEDADMDAQLSRTLIGAYVGAADLGEAIAIAQRVPPGDYAAWYVEWDRAATTVRGTADRAADKGLSTLAGQAYLRASEYRRQSYFFLRHDLTDTRVQEAYRGQRELFRRSLPWLNIVGRAHLHPVRDGPAHRAMCSVRRVTTISPAPRC